MKMINELLANTSSLYSDLVFSQLKLCELARDDSYPYENLARMRKITCCVLHLCEVLALCIILT